MPWFVFVSLFAVQCSVLRFSRYATLDVVVVSGNGTVVENKVSESARKRLGAGEHRD